MTCQCSVCSVEVKVVPQKEPKLPKTDVEEAANTAASMSVVYGSSLAPIMSAGTAGALAKLAIISRLCPSEGAIEVDRTINPLGLELGDKEHVRQVNGALVGSIAIQAFLLSVSLCIAVHMYRRLGMKRRTQRRTDTCVPEEDGGQGVRLVSRGLTAADVTYLMARSRFGWILIPASFLYAGAAFSAVSALLYSTPFFQFVAVCDLLIFLFGLFAYAAYVAHHVDDHAEVEAFPDDSDRSCLTKIIWGTSEWVTHSARGDGAWVELNHLMYDGYKHVARYWLAYELFVSFGIGALGAWSPSADHCATKSTLMIILLSLFFLSIVAVRPYLALYENVLEIFIAGVDVAIALFGMIAAESDTDIADHWAAKTAGHLAMAIVWMVTLKALIDVTVFILDERAMWRAIQEQQPPHKKKSFCAHMLCCGNTIPEESMDDYVRTKLGSEDEADGYVFPSLDELPELELKSLATSTDCAAAPCPPSYNDLNSEDGKGTFETIRMPLGSGAASASHARRGSARVGRFHQPLTPVSSQSSASPLGRSRMGRARATSNGDLQESLVSNDKRYYEASV